ncbi:MAG: hypothetical protein J6S79_05970 [Lachnospiraceae bacterium]|nr:hypothetical protein [Lachnospiraceae bacterium]
MRNVYVVTYFLLYIIEVLAAFVIFIILRHIVGDHTSLIIFGVLCVVAIPLAFVLLKRLLNSEKGKPSAMLHEAFRNEVMTNGFTQKALDMANQAMREHTSGKEMSIVYLKDFAMYSADYFNQTRQFDTARQYLEALDQKEIRSKSISFIDRGISHMLYLGVCVDTYAGLKDEKKAAEFRDEAHSRFGNKDDEMFKILLDGVDYDYYAMREEYDKAQAIADRLLTYTSDFSKRLPSKYYVNADLCMRLGKQEEAAGFMQKAWEIVKDQNAAMVQTYRLAMKRFGLTDSAQPAQNDTPQQ